MAAGRKAAANRHQENRSSLDRPSDGLRTMTMEKNSSLNPSGFSPGRRQNEPHKAYDSQMQVEKSKATNPNSDGESSQQEVKARAYNDLHDDRDDLLQSDLDEDDPDPLVRLGVDMT